MLSIDFYYLSPRSSELYKDCSNADHIDQSGYSSLKRYLYDFVGPCFQPENFQLHWPLYNAVVFCINCIHFQDLLRSHLEWRSSTGTCHSKSWLSGPHEGVQTSFANYPVRYSLRLVTLKCCTFLSFSLTALSSLTTGNVELGVFCRLHGLGRFAFWSFEPSYIGPTTDPIKRAQPHSDRCIF